MKYLGLMGMAALLAGCGAIGGITGGGNTGGTTAARTSGEDTCNAAAYAGLVGQDAVVALQIPDPKRSYRPDEAVTQDFNPARVNVVLSDEDVITAITCG